MLSILPCICSRFCQADSACDHTPRFQVHVDVVEPEIHQSVEACASHLGPIVVRLSTWAREQPAFFAGYIHNPKATEPHAHMPANQEYDAATLAALTAYFRTFTAPTAAAKPHKDPAQEPTRR